MGRMFRRAELHREFAATESSPAYDRCLKAGSRLSADETRTLDDLKALEARNGPTPCTDAFLIPRVQSYSAERADRVLRTNPALHDRWIAVARAQFAAKASEAGLQTLDAAMRAVDDPMARVSLWWGRVALQREIADSVGALATWKAFETWARRDRRPGPLAGYLQARCTSDFEYPRFTPEARAAACREFYAVVRPRRAHFIEYEVESVLARAALNVGQFAEGMPTFNRAVALADSLGWPGLQLQAYTWRGRAHQKTGRLSLAERDLEHAVAFGPRAAAPYYFSEAYHNLAHTYQSGKRYALAAAAADSYAVNADRAHSWGGGRWGARHDAGVIRLEAGWNAAARRDFETMVRIVDEINEDGFVFAGEYFEREGKLGRALEYYRRGAQISGGDPRTVSAVARVYEALGLRDSADAVARRHDADSDRWPITDGPLLPELLANRGRVKEAITLANDWARKVKTTGNVEGAAIAHLRLAELLLLDRRAVPAHIAASTADSLARSLSLGAHAITARTLMGRALVEQGKLPQGLIALQEAVRRADALPSTGALLSTNLALGAALERSGRRGEALRAYDRAGLAVERITAGLNEDAYRAGYKARQLAPFDGALRMLLDSSASVSDADAALTWSMRRKAAALTLAGQPASPSGGAAPASRASGAELRERLRSDEALVDFTMLDSSAAAIVVRRDKTTRVRLGASPLVLTTWIEALRRPLVSAPGGRIDLARANFDVELAERLYDALIKPLEGALGGVKSLAIAPDGALWYLPFAALVTSRDTRASNVPGWARAKYLLERYEIRLLPSAQFLGARAGSTLPAGFRVDAVSYDVPGGAEELTAIRSALGGARVTGRDGAGATERAALASTSNVLHLAVHGIVDDRDALASHLRFAPANGDDGMLHPSEIANRSLGSRLVVLTACEAVSGKLFAGEGLVGLARAFLLGGARQVIASEWPVAASAAAMTGVLYRELALGRSTAASLRSAQLALRGAPATAHPIHWAGFVVFDGAAR